MLYQKAEMIAQFPCEEQFCILWQVKNLKDNL